MKRRKSQSVNNKVPNIKGVIADSRQEVNSDRYRQFSYWTEFLSWGGHQAPCFAAQFGNKAGVSKATSVRNYEEF